ncbi:hypothetical protein HK103_007412 [Boothiomyces macroporosus]|uniref:NADH dehydrogenase [ubiquinone] 1 beta subcomplex subunit 9 n=1 Tax=Boothiomyces macroporosus TaxID=261099 RepID=A0AAD5UMZ8_9FUNG|nr:hypothetical protein HK103_007412 [Boothiomyces macroporosus]
MTALQLASQAHNAYVRRLYRRSLRLAADWYWRRPEYREKSMLIRELFEVNKDLQSVKQVEVCLAQAEYLLVAYAHYQPFKHITAPGGSKFERNVPFPEELIKRGVTPFDNFS